MCRSLPGRRVLGSVLLSIAATLAAPARLSAATDVTISVSIGTVAVEGAFVAISSGGSGRFGAVTNAAGAATFAGLPDATYTVVASAPGTTVGSGTLVTPTTSTLTVQVTSSGSLFSGLGAFGSQTGTVRSGGRPGVFYVNTSAIPSLYRTADFGGSWAPVTISGDDSANGIDGSARADVLATSGFPGEVAALAGNKLWYSQDFGVTWLNTNVPPGPMNNRTTLLWGHPSAAGAPSVLLLAGTDPAATMYFAVMPTSSTSPAPVLTAMAASYRGSPNDPITMANGTDAPIVAVGDTASGTVKLYRMDTTPSTSDASVTLAGIIPTTASDGSPLSPSHLFLIHLGGPMTGRAVGTAAAPNTILVYSNNNDIAAGAVVSSCTAAACTPTATTQFRDDADSVVSGTFLRGGPGESSCAATREAGAIASMSPQGVDGTIGGCWITAAGATLQVRRVNGINNNTGMAFDAGYGSTGNAVLISGDGSKGAAKSARAGTTQMEGLNRPFFPQWPVRATGGSAPDSGGVAINGLNSAVVRDIAFNPASAAELAVVMSFTGGGRVVGSVDSGSSWFTLFAQGGDSVDWWRGAGTASWILAGAGAGGNLLAATGMGSSTPFNAGTQLVHLPNTAGASIGLSPTAVQGQLVAAIEGMTGTDLAVIAAARNDMGGFAEGALSLVTLSAGPSSTVSVLTGGTFTNSAPVSLAYCPASGSAASVADKMFVAVAAGTDGGSSGGLRVVDDASKSTRTIRTIAGSHTTGDFRVVRVHCASGTVWAGRYGVGAGPGGATATALPGLVKSTDGGVTFAALTPTGRVGEILQRVRTLTIGSRSAATLVVVSSNTDVVETRDGGSQWRILNDSATASCPAGSKPPCGRNFGGEPGAIVTPPTTGSGGVSGSLGLQASRSMGLRTSSTITSDQTVLGSAAGLFTATTSSMNTASLTFAAVAKGGTRIVTEAQRVSITFSSAGSVSWSAVADATWIEITPASGTGTGSFLVGVRSGSPLPAPGTYLATVTVTTTGALVSTQQVQIALTVHPTDSTTSPFGVVDTPANGATNVTGSLPVTGWALDDIGVARVLIYRDPVAAEGGSTPVFIGTAALVSGSRPDVEALYPTQPSGYRAGWGYLLLSNMLPNQGNGTVTLHAYAEDQEGNLTLLGSRTVTAANSTGTRPFGAIDTPGQGETVSGTTLNFGWALTPQPNTIPTDGSTIAVYIDGAPIGRPSYNNFRSDIASLFPSYSNSNGAVGALAIDTTTLANGVHTIAWVVVDDGGRSDGIGSRYFTVQNGTGGSTVDGYPLHATPGVSMLAERTAAELLSAPARRTTLSAKLGYGEGSVEAIRPGGEGAYLVRGREITPLEIRLDDGGDAHATYAGYLLAAGEARPLPIGAVLGARTGVFTWMPGVGFAGRVDLLFVREAGPRRERMSVTVMLEPFSTPRPEPKLVIDAPAAEAVVRGSFLVGGWAADLGAATGSGIDAVHVWAYPLDRTERDPIFAGSASTGGFRPDVFTAVGEQFAASGFNLWVTQLESGRYDIVVYGRSTVTGTFNIARVVRVDVQR